MTFVIRSVRIPTDIVRELDVASAENGIKSFNKLALDLISHYLEVKKWEREYKASINNNEPSRKLRGVEIRITPKVMRRIYEKCADLVTVVPDNEDVILGYVEREVFDDLVSQGLVNKDGSPCEDWIHT
jgi:hypothetical protein